MMDKLEELSPTAKAVLIAAIIVAIPLSGWLGYRFGFFLGSN